MPLRINVVAWSNGVGLTRDIALLANALRAGGFDVHVTAIGRGKLRKWFRPVLARWRGRLRRLFSRRPPHDVNIMLEHIRPEDFGSASHTLFVPNPEWCTGADMAQLPKIKGVLAKTRHAEAMFSSSGWPTSYIGFTSDDRHDPQVPRERRFFHLAGRSVNKGTDALLSVWRRHPEWPVLTVVQSPRTATLCATPAANIDHRIDYLDDGELRRIQNACRFHICCSETEGFGHYLVEAMSVGAVVLTTDGEPMNELVDAARGVCVPYCRTGRQELAITYFVDEAELEKQIERLLSMDAAAVEALGAEARRWYLANNAAFPARLKSAVLELLAH